MNAVTNNLLDGARQAQMLLNPYAENILSATISLDRIELHLDGQKFREIANDLKVEPQGSWHESGWHCGFEISEEGKPTIRLHALLQ